MKKIIFLLFSLFFLGACSSLDHNLKKQEPTSVYKGSATLFIGLNQSARYKIKNNLKKQNLSKNIEKAARKQGFNVVRNPDSADYVLLLDDLSFLESASAGSIATTIFSFYIVPPNISSKLNATFTLARSSEIYEVNERYYTHSSALPWTKLKNNAETFTYATDFEWSENTWEVELEKVVPKGLRVMTRKILHQMIEEYVIN
jgi:hypothetical protein